MRAIYLFLVFVFLAEGAIAQDKGAGGSAGGSEAADEKFPAAKRALLALDLNLAEILSEPIVDAFVDHSFLREFGLIGKLDDLKNIQRLSLIMGPPNRLTGDTEYVVRIEAVESDDMAGFVGRLHGDGEFEIVERNGWSVVQLARAWPGVIRFKGNRLEVGTPLYIQASKSKLMSPALAKEWSALTKSAQVRFAFDSHVAARLFDEKELVPDALFDMIRYGEFVSFSSLALYGQRVLSDLSSISLQVDFASKQVAQCRLVPSKGREEVVRSLSKVGFDFLMFHCQLPVRELKRKNRAVAPAFEKLLQKVEYSIEKGVVQITLDRPDAIEEEMDILVKKLRTSSREMLDWNRFRQVAIANHNHHDAMKQFVMAPAKPGRKQISDKLSWRVGLLRFIELGHVYREMDLDAGWDKRENRAVVPKGEDTFVLNNGALICGIATDPPVWTFGSIHDGSSNTIMLMENRNATMTPWTKPMDFTLEEAVKTVSKLKSGDSLWIALYDGSVGRIKSPKDSGVTEKELKGLFGPRDGEIVDMDKYIDTTRPGLFQGLGERPSSSNVFEDLDARIIEDIELKVEGIRID